MIRLAVATFACWVLLGSGKALAYEDRMSLGVELGGAAFTSDVSGSPVGPLLGVDVSFGLNDVWTLRSHLSASIHPGDDVASVGVLGAELLYTLDVVQWVPFFGAGVDTFVMHQAEFTTGDVAIHAVVGLDYLLSRDWLLGVDVRALVLPFRSPGDRFDPIYFTLNARMEWLFDL